MLSLNTIITSAHPHVCIRHISAQVGKDDLAPRSPPCTESQCLFQIVWILVGSGSTLHFISTDSDLYTDASHVCPATGPLLTCPHHGQMLEPRHYNPMPRWWGRLSNIARKTSHDNPCPSRLQEISLIS